VIGYTIVPPAAFDRHTRLSLVRKSECAAATSYEGWFEATCGSAKLYQQAKSARLSRRTAAQRPFNAL
jgi:hypothetical protein